MSLEADTLAALASGTGIVVVLALWLRNEHRDALFFDKRTARSTFNCIKCGQLYSCVGRPHAAPCPNCHFENSRLSF